MKTFKFYTLGCKVNQYETQALMEELISRGLRPARGKADLYVINTCTVTGRADSKCRDAVLKAKKENPEAVIAAVGCLAQHNADYLAECGADYIVPQDKKYLLIDQILNNKVKGKKNIWDLSISSFLYRRAFLKVQDGCDNFCSFCKIPYLRGKPSTRPRREILAEAERLSRKHREIVLCGVNIGLYGKDRPEQGSFPSLVKDILNIPGLGRLRISSISPLHVNDELIRLFDHPELCPHLHLPFQSGDDEILVKMNKKTSTDLYLRVAEKVREIDPDFALSCDIMAGFPGEDNISFKKTCGLLEKIKPMRMHVFTFSPREKTGFEGMKLKNRKEIKSRSCLLKFFALKWAEEYASRFKKKALVMIAEEKKAGFITGYTENYLKVFLPDDNISLGDMVRVTIDKVEKGRIYAKKQGIADSD